MIYKYILLYSDKKVNCFFRNFLNFFETIKKYHKMKIINTFTFFSQLKKDKCKIFVNQLHYFRVLTVYMILQRKQQRMTEAK